MKWIFSKLINASETLFHVWQTLVDGGGSLERCCLEGRCDWGMPTVGEMPRLLPANPLLLLAADSSASCCCCVGIPMALLMLSEANWASYRDTDGWAIESTDCLRNEVSKPILKHWYDHKLISVLLFHGVQLNRSNSISVQ